MKVLRWLAFLLAIVGLISQASAQVAQSEEPPFTITISTLQDVVKAGSDVKVRAVMKNTSDRDVSYTVGTGPIINMDVRDPEGKPVPETPEGRKVHGTDHKDGPGSVLTVVRLPLKPGKTLEGESVLNKEYDLNKPGKYFIQAMRMDPTSKAIVKSNTITVTVVP